VRKVLPALAFATALFVGAAGAEDTIRIGFIAPSTGGARYALADSAKASRFSSKTTVALPIAIPSHAGAAIERMTPCEPLSNLTLRRESELCLGLAHYTDGVAGARNVLSLRPNTAPRFSVATDTGFRHDP
jgi:hypothetical protein